MATLVSNMTKQEEYTITVFGPEGSVEYLADDLDGAMSIAENLVEASNGYHDVKIEAPLQ